jgi:hypothetical protein
LSREAEDIITLGRLLKRARSEEQRLAVDGIVASALTVGEKIQEIQKLDAGGEQDTRDDGEEAKRTRPLRYRLPALADILKRPYSRLPYLPFLFGDYRRILGFGKLTEVLEPVRFLPDVRLHRSVLLFLNQELKRWAGELNEILSVGLEDSWHYLRKAEYNVLVVMKQLCEKIQSTSFNLFDHKDPNVINKLRSLETLYLVFYYEEDYQQLLHSSVQKIGKNDPRVSGRLPAAEEAIRRILEFDGSTPSLYNILLGLNMVKYRRYLTMRDLLCTDLGELLNTRDFACPPEVKERIRALVVEGRRRLEELREKQETTARIKKYLTFDDSAALSFEPLRVLYEQPRTGEPGYLLASDTEDAACLAPRLFDILDRTYTPLLNGQVDLEEVGGASVFSHDFFQLEFQRIRRITGRVWDSGEEKVPLSRLLDLQHSTKGMKDVEAEILRQVNEGIEVLLEMAKKVETVLQTRSKGGGRTGGPLDPMILHGKKFSIPHEKRRIVSPGILHSRSVAEALGEFVGLCFTIAVFWHYLPVYGPLEEEPRQSKELKSQLEVLNRLAGP